MFSRGEEMYQYEYIDDTPRDFPTLGLHEVKKGDIVESETELNSPFLKDVIPKPKTKGDEKIYYALN